MLKMRRLLLRNEGFIAIEFALVIIPFIISILFIMEICRVIYIMSSIDIILSETSGAVATSTSTVLDNSNFQKRVAEVSNGWALLLTGKNVKINTNIQYCQTIRNLANNQCTPTAASPTAALAIYEITVPYEPVFFIFPSSFVQKQMFRRVVLIQEHNINH